MISFGSAEKDFVIFADKFVVPVRIIPVDAEKFDE